MPESLPYAVEEAKERRAWVDRTFRLAEGCWGVKTKALFWRRLLAMGCLGPAFVAEPATNWYTFYQRRVQDPRLANQFIPTSLHRSGDQHSENLALVAKSLPNTPDRIV